MESKDLTLHKALRAAFVIGLMYACFKGPSEKDRPRGGGMIE